jgi:hypothetical protein
MLQQGPGSVNQLGIYPSYRLANGVPIPNFIADENSESGLETPTESLATTPPDEGSSREYVATTSKALLAVLNGEIRRCLWLSPPLAISSKVVGDYAQTSSLSRYWIA